MQLEMGQTKDDGRGGDKTADLLKEVSLIDFKFMF